MHKFSNKIVKFERAEYLIYKINVKNLKPTKSSRKIDFGLERPSSVSVKNYIKFF